VRAGYLAGRKHAPESLGRVLVLGLGKSGKACVEYLRPLLGRRVEALAVAAGAETPEGRGHGGAPRPGRAGGGGRPAGPAGPPRPPPGGG